MAEPIDRIRAKVHRAKHHVEDFQRAASDFYSRQPHPYAIGVKEDADARKRLYYLTRIDEVPLTVETIVADALGNLREAVDHIAYQLEVAGCGAPPKHRVYFPIANSATKYKTLRAAYIKCAGKTAIDAINATEPYKGGKGHGLWQLDSLKKADKHHLLVATQAIYSVDFAPTFMHVIRQDPEEWVQQITLKPLFFRNSKPEHPLHVGHTLFSESLDVEMDKNRQFKFDISFDQPGIVDSEPALKTLNDLTNLVDGLVSGFARLLT